MSNAVDPKIQTLIKSAPHLSEKYKRIKVWSKEQGLYLSRTFDLMFDEFIVKHIEGEDNDGDNVPEVPKD